MDHNSEKRDWIKANPLKEKPSDEKP